MTGEQSSRETGVQQLDFLEDVVSEMHGHRVAVTGQHVRDGKHKRAVASQAQADAFRTVLEFIERVRNGDDWEPTVEAYMRLSHTVVSAEHEVAESNGSKHLRGLE